MNILSENIDTIRMEDLEITVENVHSHLVNKMD